MAATLKPAGQLLRWSIFLFLLPGGVLPCSNLTVNSPVILGTEVTASCTIWRNRCPVRLDGDIQIVWKLDEEFLQGVQYSLNHGAESSNITIRPLNRTVTALSCYVKRNKTLHLMNLTQIHAGYPPPQPHNLSCVMNFTTMNLTCHWDPGQDGLLPGGEVTLTRFISRSNCSARHDPLLVCRQPVTQNFCIIRRASLQLFQNMIFQVTVKNGLGVVQSEPLCADPMDLVKLDPPVIQAIQSIPEETDCVAVEWEAVRGNVFKQICDMRYRMESNQEWMLVYNITSPPEKTLQCGFLLGTRYQFQMRCRKHPLGYWSDWSPTKNFTTHEKVPSGELDTWWTVKSTEDEKGIEVQLLWKPMKSNETNGKILGYQATLGTRQYHHKKLPVLCNTTEMHCSFSLPPGNRRINLMAYNKRGLSPPTAVFLFEKEGQPVSKFQVHPEDENRFQVCWNPPGLPTTGYIIEWHKSCGFLDQLSDNNISWTKVQNGNITHTLIQENIEPYQRYNISIYPLYMDGVGRAQYVEAYTVQKAPSEAPKLQAGSISKSTAELHWEPILVEKQNGFITNYTIFWTGTNEEMSSAIMSSSLNKFTITGLRPSRMYRVHIMASTVAGSANGTTVTLYTKALDDIDILTVYTLVGLLLFMIIILIICFQKSKRMKTQFWPSVPDPANSSLGRWAPAILQEEVLQAPKACELSPTILSAILVIEADEKKCLSCGKSEPTVKALEDGPTASPVSYSHKAPRPASYMNSPESVQYATVVGDSYRSQEETSSSFYMRSNSTQPLLSDLVPSPKPYENLCFHSDQAHGDCSFQEDVIFLDRVLIDFPLLQGLKISGDEDLNQLRKL
ncbi:granulocyte colony-stimulating factor receptor [Tiliqua scincoides]|uniref:granulocyte colony-stimulating factor receptor n=1 Tax=Tiliqua scincoides TaxID=71010 RepID=UPI0034623789